MQSAAARFKGYAGRPPMRTMKMGDAVDAVALLDVGEHERSLAAHPPRVTLHHAEVGADAA